MSASTDHIVERRRGNPGTFAQTVAANVRAECSRRQITGVELSRELGIAQPAISLRLRGKRSWSLDELDHLARFLNVDMGKLVQQADASIYGLDLLAVETDTEQVPAYSWDHAAWLELYNDAMAVSS
jgi:transcriptional regulator with XRE-family HTH domain